MSRVTINLFSIITGGVMFYKTDVSVIAGSILTACLFLCIESAFGQVPTAVPFLRISTSPEANGQGSTSVSRMTDDNYSIITNPAHLGFMSLQSSASISFYPTKTNWLPGLGIQDITMNTLALNGGINLEEYFDCPLSLGIAYSRVDLNLGNWYRTSNGPDIIGTFNGEEHADAISVSAGADFGIKIALGITFRKIESNLADSEIGQESGSGNSSAWSRDYGLLINLPVTKLVTDKWIEHWPLTPVVEISFGSALTNVGEKMFYIDKAQADPLPRNISMGTSLELGFKYSKTNSKLISFVWSRQADNLLVERDRYGIPNYRSLFGDLDFVKNVIKGEWTDKVEVSQGWEIGLGEFLFVRGGSFDGAGYTDIKTSGLGISASGLLKIIYLFTTEDKTLMYYAEHFDIRYNRSEYTVSDYRHPLNDTDYSSLAFLMKL
jgi:hypothetical protein